MGDPLFVWKFEYPYYGILICIEVSMEICTIHITLSAYRLYLNISFQSLVQGIQYKIHVFI